MLYHSKHQNAMFQACLLRRPVSTGFYDRIHSPNVIFTDPGYVLLLPCQQDPVPPPLINKIVASLATRFDVPVKVIRSHLRTASLRRFGKVQRLDGGDLMNTSALVAFGDDRRDAMFVHVGCIFDHHSCQ
jgi:hypothetical protein